MYSRSSQRDPLKSQQKSQSLPFRHSSLPNHDPGLLSLISESVEFDVEKSQQQGSVLARARIVQRQLAIAQHRIVIAQHEAEIAKQSVIDVLEKLQKVVNETSKNLEAAQQAVIDEVVAEQAVAPKREVENVVAITSDAASLYRQNVAALPLFSRQSSIAATNTVVATNVCFESTETEDNNKTACCCGFFAKMFTRKREAVKPAVDEVSALSNKNS